VREQAGNGLNRFTVKSTTEKVRDVERKVNGIERGYFAYKTTEEFM
jgi:hypothetical protein